MPQILLLLPLITRYSKYIPFIIGAVQAVEELMRGRKRGDEKKALVLNALRALVQAADTADLIDGEDASKIIDLIVKVMNALGDFKKTEVVANGSSSTFTIAANL